MIDRSTPYLDSTDIDTLRLKEILLLGDEDELVTRFNTFFSSLFYIKTPPLSYLKGMCIYLLTTVHKHLGKIWASRSRTSIGLLHSMQAP